MRIMESLMDGPKSVTQISEATNMEQSRVSHNLRILVAWDFVGCTPQGRHRMYSINKNSVGPLLKAADRYLEKHDGLLESCGILRGRKTCSHLRG
jgi:DNA-binding transcriptional ArsR family regulator